MSYPPARRRANHGLAGARARQLSADSHQGPYTEFLGRHVQEAKQATQGSRRDREQFARLLLRRAGDPRNVRIAIEHCASRGQAAGPNGLRPTDLDSKTRWVLARELGRLIHQGLFRPSRSRTKWIDKGGNRGKRPIRIQNLEDRVVERAVLQVIRPLTEAQYLDCSFGFRNPGRSREEALATAEQLAHDHHRWTWISEDLKDAFEHVPANRMLQVLRRMIPGDPICNFIGRIARKPSGMGIRQGGPLSPELLNVYIHWMLDRWLRENFPEVPYLRVADDLLLLAESPEEADHLYRELTPKTIAMGMPLKGNPFTSIRDISRGSVRWLGYEMHRPNRELVVSIASRSWEHLEEHLQMVWEEPLPSLAANDSIRGWISQQGAAYDARMVEEVYSRLSYAALNMGFSEIPSHTEVASLWHGAYLRDWVRIRREVVVRIRRGRMLADGSADQHSDVATLTGCSSEGLVTEIPLQDAPIRREVSLYSDGSCLGARGVGSWAYLLVDHETNHRQSDADSHPRTTSNRMELTAVIQGLSALPKSSRVHLVTDSRYVFRGITELLPLWRNRGWRSSGRGPRQIKNHKLWQRLAAQLERHDVDCQWVRGHAGHAENEFVDRLAQEVTLFR